jgi:hypothetical protein
MFTVVATINNILPSKKYKKKTHNMQTLKELRQAVPHAKLICLNYEDTHECKVAWQKVDILVQSFQDNEYEYND